MKFINQDMQPVAYMIRNDGKIIKLPKNTIHPYTETVSQTIDNVIPFMLNYSNDDQIKGVCLQFIINYVKWNGEKSKYVCDELSKKSPEFASEINEIYEDHFQDYENKNVKRSQVIAEYDNLKKLIQAQLNQEFLRARFGGAYNSGQNGEIYFRISSKNFNWFNIIWRFVYDNQNYIDNVTVMRDYESDYGHPAVSWESLQYLVHNGEKIENMPVDQFINLSGNPVFENLNVLKKSEYVKNLMNGNPILKSFGISNRFRTLERYIDLQDIITYAKG